jgi:hypothetical protein
VVWGFDETKVLVLFGDSWFGSFEIAAGTGRESFPLLGLNPVQPCKKCLMMLLQKY